MAPSPTVMAQHDADNRSSEDEVGPSVAHRATAKDPERQRRMLQEALDQNEELHNRVEALERSLKEAQQRERMLRVVSGANREKGRDSRSAAESPKEDGKLDSPRLRNAAGPDNESARLLAAATASRDAALQERDEAVTECEEAKARCAREAEARQALQKKFEQLQKASEEQELSLQKARQACERTRRELEGAQEVVEALRAQRELSVKRTSAWSGNSRLSKSRFREDSVNHSRGNLADELADLRSADEEVADRLQELEELQEETERRNRELESAVRIAEAIASQKDEELQKLKKQVEELRAKLPEESSTFDSILAALGRAQEFFKQTVETRISEQVCCTRHRAMVPADRIPSPDGPDSASSSPKRPAGSSPKRPALDMSTRKSGRR